MPAILFGSDRVGIRGHGSTTQAGHEGPINLLRRVTGLVIPLVSQISGNYRKAPVVLQGGRRRAVSLARITMALPAFQIPIKLLTSGNACRRWWESPRYDNGGARPFSHKPLREGFNIFDHLSAVLLTQE